MGRDRGFIPPVRVVPGGWALHFDAEEAAFLDRLLGELRDLLTSEGDSPMLQRLFPTAYPHDEEKEAEYQRLMRDELVESRVAAIDEVRRQLGQDGADPPDVLAEADVIAFMQSINAVRLVLGTMLGITDDASAEAADDADTPNHHLYGYLGWVLEWTVRALSAS